MERSARHSVYTHCVRECLVRLSCVYYFHFVHISTTFLYLLKGDRKKFFAMETSLSDSFGCDLRGGIEIYPFQVSSFVVGHSVGL